MAPTEHASTAEPKALSRVALGVPVLVVDVRMDPVDAAWLSAVGLTTGVTLTVLRRAPFGGPLHVATSLGGELALGPQLCDGIFVEAAS
ncbi:MAG: FeoA family protein [Polyangiaceae bacterium]